MAKKDITDLDVNNYIISNSEDYLHTRGKTLEQRLENIKLDNTEEKQIIVQKTKKTIFDKALGKFPGGDLIATFLTWNEEVDTEISNAKKAKLLEQFFDKVDDSQMAISKLQLFLTNPQGNVLFNKILRILDDYPPDNELIEQLSNALKFIIKVGNFEKLFDQHKYALAQIEKLTPQALAILADNKAYPILTLTNSISFGTKITSDWHQNFVNTYAQSKDIIDEDIINRISHSVNELVQQGYIEVHKVEEKTVKCVVTSVGNYLLPYLDVN